ncbi:MAG: hypothetical protein ACJ8KX_10610 [Chthoniobacterales bacterium]
MTPLHGQMPGDATNGEVSGVAAAQAAVDVARAEYQAAKRRRKRAKEKAREAKKRLRRAKEELVQAKRGELKLVVEPTVPALAPAVAR